MLEKMEKFIAWQESHELTMSIYAVTKQFPKFELYSLTNQIQRAAVSVPSNIAEGKALSSIKEYLRHIYIARGSLEELKYQLYLSKELGYLKEPDYNKLASQTTKVGKLLNGLIKSLKSQLN